MRRPPKPWAEPSLCCACRCSVPRWQRLCDLCWRLLPAARRAEIRDAREREAWHLVAERVRAAADWLRRHGPAAQAARVCGEREHEVSGGELAHSAAEGWGAE